MRKIQKKKLPTLERKPVHEKTTMSSSLKQRLSTDIAEYWYDSDSENEEDEDDEVNLNDVTVGEGRQTLSDVIGSTRLAQRLVFKDYSNWHSDLCLHENRFLGLTSVWKPVFRADISMETGFHASIGRNANWNNKNSPQSETKCSIQFNLFHYAHYTTNVKFFHTISVVKIFHKQVNADNHIAFTIYHDIP